MADAPAPPPLDVGALRRHLDGSHAAVRDRVRVLLARPELDRDGVADLDRAAYRDRVLGWARTLAADGVTALGLPAAHGGAGDTAAGITAFETLAHGDLSLLVKVGVQTGLWGGAIHQLGTAGHHARWLPEVATLALPGCFAMTERGHGSDVQSLRTTLRHDPDTDEIVVTSPDEDSGKDWIGNAARHGRMAVVFGQLEVGGERHGVHAVVVPIRDEDGAAMPGVRIEDCGAKLGLEGVDNGRLWFDDVRVPRADLLDRFGAVTDDGRYASPIESDGRRFFTMLGTLIQGRVSICGASIAATKNALTIAVRHAVRRRQFADREGEEVVLLDYRTHQRRLLLPLATTIGLAAAQEEVVADVHRLLTEDALDEDERRELEARAAGLKAVASWHASATIADCREACGGLGYLRDSGFAALKADTDVFTTFEGDNTVLLQLVGKELLTEFRSDFGHLDALGTAWFVAEQVVGTLVERSAVRQVAGAIVDAVPGRSDEDDEPLDRARQMALLSAREEHLVTGVARRLQARVSDGEDAFAVFLDTQVHLLAAARAHVDRLVLEAFDRSVRRADPELRPHLDRLCDLHALRVIEDGAAWFLEHGRLSSGRSKQVTRAIDALCGEVRPYAARIVDAFAIPPEALRSGIGRADG